MSSRLESTARPAAGGAPFRASGHASLSRGLAARPTATRRPASAHADHAPPAAAPAGLDPLLDEGQASRYLRLSRRTLQGWRLKGGGPPFVRLGRIIRYRRSDLATFIRERLRLSTSDPGPGTS
jgi:hypothetical protein